MPLIKSASKSAFDKNYKELRASGHSKEEALNICKAVAWKAKHEKKKK